MIAHLKLELAFLRVTVFLFCQLPSHVCNKRVTNISIYDRDGVNRQKKVIWNQVKKQAFAQTTANEIEGTNKKEISVAK